MNRLPLNLMVPELIRSLISAAQALPTAVRLQKELIARWRETDPRSAVEYGINAFSTCFATDEPREAMMAFLEKRKPRFQG